MPLDRAALACLTEQPPPRLMDESVRRAALDLYFPKIARIILPALAVLLVAASGIAVYALASRGRFEQEWRMLREPTAQCDGIVRTVTVRRGSKGKKTYRYDFAFYPHGASAGPRAGYCFSDKAVAAAGDTVTVEHLAADPAAARMKGCRLNPAPLFVIVMLPASSLVFMAVMYGLWAYRKRWLERILREGVIAAATVREIKSGPKNTKIIVLDVPIEGQCRQEKVQLPMGKKHLALMNERREAGAPVTVLVHPARKKHLIILDLLWPGEAFSS